MVSVPEAHLRDLQKRVEGLTLLIDVSTLISSTIELDHLMPLVMEKAKGIMAAEACSILFYNRETNKLEFEVAMCGDESASEILKKKITLDMGQGIAGWVAQNLTPLVIDDVSTDRRFFRGADKITGFTTESIIAVPLLGRSGLIGVAEIINPKRKDYDPAIFALLCRQFAIAIENALFHKESIERERLKQQLEIASALQKSFLPESPVLKKAALTVSAVNISASKIGGDLYDFVEPRDGKVGVLIGDVSGKGISAALYMAKFISDFRYITHKVAEPGSALNHLNALLSRTPRGMFLTAVYAVLDIVKGDLKISVAGHPPFLWLTEAETRVMDILSGPPLGILPVEYPSTDLSLRKGDRLLFLTDGVFDAKNREGERLGFEKTVDFIKNHRNEERLMEKIVDYVNDFSKGVEQADDLTMVEVRWGA